MITQKLSLICGAGPYLVNETSIVHGDLVSINHDLGSDCSRTGTAFYVNGTNLNTTPLFHGDIVPSNPTSSCPYLRLAGFGNDDKSDIYLYHQVNATTFPIDIWDDSAEA